MPKLVLRGIILSPLTGAMERWICEPDEYTISEDLISAIQAEPDALDILVDSPGGDIFAANSVAMAVIDWLVAHPQGKATVTVQGMAASAAAALIVAVKGPRCRIACHRNSQLMFHGVYTTVYDGGAQKFSDTAEALEKTNDQIRSALLSRTQTPPALIAQWFAEGREGWVTAAEAMEWQIVDEVIDLDAAPESESTQAFLNQLKSHPAMNLTTLKKLFLRNEAEDDPEKKPEDSAAQNEGEDTPEKKPEDSAAQNEGDDDPEKKPKEDNEGDDDDPEEEIGELKSALAKLQETVAALERQLSDAKATNAKLTAGLRTTPAQANPAEPATFEDAIKELRKDHPHWTYNDAFVQAAKQFPRLWKQKMSR